MQNLVMHERLVDEPERPRGPLAMSRLNHSAVRFLIVGGIAFVLDFSLLALLHGELHWPLWLSTGIAFIIGFAFSYTAQRIFSFNSLAPHGPALVRYTVLVGFNALATIGIVALINTSAFGWGGGKVIATAVTTLWNYFAYRYWVFASPSRSKPTPNGITDL